MNRVYQAYKWIHFHEYDWPISHGFSLGLGNHTHLSPHPPVLVPFLIMLSLHGPCLWVKGGDENNHIIISTCPSSSPCTPCLWVKGGDENDLVNNIIMVAWGTFSSSPDVSGRQAAMSHQC